MSEESYSTLDIERIMKIPRGRLREWLNEKYIIPSIQSPGQGSKAIFKRDDLYKIAVFKEYIELGFSRKLAADMIATLKDESTKQIICMDYLEAKKKVDKDIGI